MVTSNSLENLAHVAKEVGALNLMGIATDIDSLALEVNVNAALCDGFDELQVLDIFAENAKRLAVAVLSVIMVN